MQMAPFSTPSAGRLVLLFLLLLVVARSSVIRSDQESPLAILVDTLWWQNNRGRNLDRIMKIGRENGVTLDLQNDQGWSPLCFAVAFNVPHAVTAFLDYGASVNEQENDGWSPLHFAGFHGATDIATILLKHGADPTLRNKATLLPSTVAKNEGYDALAAMLAEQAQARISNTEEHNLALVLDLIRDSQGQPATPVHANMVLSYSSGHSPLTLAASLGDSDAVKELVELGGNVKYSNARTGDTVLHYAVSAGSTELVRMLLEVIREKSVAEGSGDATAASSVNSPNNAGSTPLNLAESLFLQHTSAGPEDLTQREARLAILEALQREAGVPTAAELAEAQEESRKKEEERKREEARQAAEMKKKKAEAASKTFLAP